MLLFETHKTRQRTMLVRSNAVHLFHLEINAMMLFCVAKKISGFTRTSLEMTKEFASYTSRGCIVIHPVKDVQLSSIAPIIHDNIRRSYCSYALVSDYRHRHTCFRKKSRYSYSLRPNRLQAVFSIQEFHQLSTAPNRFRRVRNKW